MATPNASESMEMSGKGKSHKCGKQLALGAGIGGGRLGMGLAFFIVSLLLLFDFLNYVHVLLW